MLSPLVRETTFDLLVSGRVRFQILSYDSSYKSLFLNIVQLLSTDIILPLSSPRRLFSLCSLGNSSSSNDFVPGFEVSYPHLLINMTPYCNLHAFGLRAPHRLPGWFFERHSGATRFPPVRRLNRSLSHRRAHPLPADTSSVPTITDGYARSRSQVFPARGLYVGLTVH